MKKLVVIGIACALPGANAYAFGLGDLVSIGIQAGTKVVGAAVDAGIDKVKDSLRDPEAEAAKKREQERQFAEMLQKRIDEIESTPNLRPLDRERLVLMLQKQYEAAQEMRAFVERAEAQQRAQRDSLLTFGGIAGVVGEAALNTPSMVVARADAMVAAGIPQAKSRAVLAQVDAMPKHGTPGKAQVIGQALQAARNGAIVMASTQSGSDPPILRDVDSDATNIGAVTPSPSTTPQPPAAAQPDDAFSPDLGKKLWVEFVGSPRATAQLREQLASRGHQLAASAGAAEVSYRVEGEYAVLETRQYEGLTRDLGAILEDPAQTIPPPQKKMTGSIGLGLNRLVVGMAAAQGQPVSAAMLPREQTTFRQEVLLVIARQPNGGKETRASVRVAEDSQEMLGARLASRARDALYEKVGLMAGPAEAGDSHP